MKTRRRAAVSGWAYAFAVSSALLLLAAGPAHCADEASDDFVLGAIADAHNTDVANTQYEIGPAETVHSQERWVSLDVSRSEFGGWVFTGSWIYFAPALDNTYFAINSADPIAFPTGTRINNNFGYQSGFRIGAAYQLVDDRRTLQVNYTWLDAAQQKTVAGSYLWATVGRADFASAFESYAGTAWSSLDVTYHRLDASFSQPWPVFDDDINFRYGIEYADLGLNAHHEFVSSTQGGHLAEDTSTLGIGPEFGIGIDHALFHFAGRVPGKLRLDMLTTASLLLSRSNGHVQTVLAQQSILDVIDDNAARLIPALHARVALNYEVYLGNYQTIFSGGYEFHSYIGGLTRVEFPDDVADGLATNRYENFNLHGFFVSATLCF